MTNRLYHAFKQSLDGNHVKWGYVSDLSLSEARDANRFPYGRQFDSDGRAFIWCYAFMPRYVATAEAGFKAMRRVPMPSAASAILQKLTQ